MWLRLISIEFFSSFFLINKCTYPLAGIILRNLSHHTSYLGECQSPSIITSASWTGIVCTALSRQFAFKFGWIVLEHPCNRKDQGHLSQSSQCLRRWQRGGLGSFLHIWICYYSYTHCHCVNSGKQEQFCKFSKEVSMQGSYYDPGLLPKLNQATKCSGSRPR